MKSNKLAPKKHVAQAMVEFAIVLPILLLLLYGLLEVGRLLFMYSSIVTATRQASRYGSATGMGTVNAVPRYQDCAGIKAAAQRADYLNAFEDNDIWITYDNGPGTGGPEPWVTAPVVPPWRDICDGTPTDTAVAPNTNNTTRIVVSIRGHFDALVPLVPIGDRPITAQSGRTILMSISIDVTDTPVGYVSPTPTQTPTLTFTPSNTPTASVSPTASATLLYTLTPSNTPPPSATWTATLPPTATLPATATLAMTSTSTQTASPTAIPACGIIKSLLSRPGNPIVVSENYMWLDIPNPTSYTVAIDKIIVAWNHDLGAAGNKNLRLLSTSFNESTFWEVPSPGIHAPLYNVPISTPLNLPPGGARLQFTFDTTYKNRSGEEWIQLRFSTPGCEQFEFKIPQ